MKVISDFWKEFDQAEEGAVFLFGSFDNYGKIIKIAECHAWLKWTHKCSDDYARWLETSEREIFIHDINSLPAVFYFSWGVSVEIEKTNEIMDISEMKKYCSFLRINSFDYGDGDTYADLSYLHDIDHEKAFKIQHAFGYELIDESLNVFSLHFDEDAGLWRWICNPQRR